MPGDELYAPLAYSWWWTALGTSAIVLAVAWVVTVLIMTRRTEDETVVVPPPLPTYYAGPFDSFATVRPVYLSRLDDVERRYRAGELDPRGLHLELSAVVRDFGTVRLGTDTRVLTLTELRRAPGTQPIAALIETYYRPSFGPELTHPGAGPAAIEGARQVVQRW